MKSNSAINLTQPFFQKQLFLLILVIFTSSISNAQDNYHSLYAENMKINNTGMYVLGVWAVSNMVTGAYGWAKYKGENKYFHQMNMFWNVVNLSIASYALISNHQTDYTLLGPDEILKKQINTEKLFLINTGLDVLYVGTGFLLKHLSDKSKRKDLMRGYGNSVILQGSFLFVFDAIMYSILKTNRLQYIESLGLSISENGLGLHLSIGF